MKSGRFCSFLFGFGTRMVLDRLGGCNGIFGVVNCLGFGDAAPRTLQTKMRLKDVKGTLQ